MREMKYTEIIHNVIWNACMNKSLRTYILLPLYLSIILFGSQTFAQSTRGLVNEGVELYNEKKFSDAEVNFKKGTELDPNNFESHFNLGDAYYKQERYDEALKLFQSALSKAKTDEQKAKIYHNVGNSLLKSQKIKESISAYKEALKLNPEDQETKYNLSYALNMLNNQNQNQQQQNDKNEKNENENKDQQNQNQQQNQQKDQQQNNQQQQPQNRQKQEQEITKQEAERILEALKENEKDLQKQLRKIRGQRVKTEKDW